LPLLGERRVARAERERPGRVRARACSPGAAVVEPAPLATGPRRRRAWLTEAESERALGESLERELAELREEAVGERPQPTPRSAARYSRTARVIGRTSTKRSNSS